MRQKEGRCDPKDYHRYDAESIKLIKSSSLEYLNKSSPAPGSTALHIACGGLLYTGGELRKPNIEIIDLLLNAGVDIKKKDGRV